MKFEWSGLGPWSSSIQSGILRSIIPPTQSWLLISLHMTFSNFLFGLNEIKEVIRFFKAIWNGREEIHKGG